MPSTRDEDLRIVMVEDDEDDQLLAREAFREIGIAHPVDFVVDGEALLAHLRGGYAATTGMVLLDLNMPRMSGHEVLAAMRADDTLRHIPVVVLTTSNLREDVLKSYQLGANAFMTKPKTYKTLVETMRQTCTYWLDVVHLPDLN